MSSLQTADPAPKASSSLASWIVVPGVFLATWVAARWGVEVLPQGSAEALAVALLPVPALAWLIHWIVRGIRTLDELEKRIQLEALALAFPAALVIVFTAGLLDLAGFHGEGNWDLPRLLPLLLLPYWLGMFLARRRYA
jgi:hypothetical protein